MRALVLAAALAAAGPAAAAGFAIGGVALGDREATVKARFPSAHCQALEWKSDAAERRCDDSRAPIAGIETHLTFYLKGDVVQAFDLRFHTRDLQRVLAHFKERFGPPKAEGVEQVARGGRPPIEVFKARWSAGRDKAVLSSQPERKRSALNVWRGNFAQEIYKVH